MGACHEMPKLAPWVRIVAWWRNVHQALRRPSPVTHLLPPWTTCATPLSLPLHPRSPTRSTRTSHALPTPLAWLPLPSPFPSPPLPAPSSTSLPHPAPLNPPACTHPRTPSAMGGWAGNLLTRGLFSNHARGRKTTPAGPRNLAAEAHGGDPVFKPEKRPSFSVRKATPKKVSQLTGRKTAPFLGSENGLVFGVG